MKIYGDYERKYGLFAEGDEDGEGTGGEGGNAAAEAAAAEAAAKAEADKGDETSWRDSITDENARKFADDSTDLNHFAQRAMDMRAKLSNAIIPPGEKATPEEIAAYDKKIGVPEAADKYEFATPDGYELTDDDKAFRSSAGDVFHNLKVTQSQAEGLSDWWNAIQEATAAEAKAADEKYAKETQEALDVKWGADKERNMAARDLAAREFFGENFEAAREIMDSNGRFVLDNPILSEAFAKVGLQMSEDRIGTTLTAGERDTVSEQIAALRTRQADAQAKGDNTLANKLYQDEQALIARLGNSPIVGAQGRAA